MQAILDICKGMPSQRFAPGDVLMQEGENSGRLFFVISGEFEILKGDYQINVVAEPGSIFGEVSVLLGLPHMATVRALTEGEAYVVEGTEEFLHANSEINFYLAKMLALRLHGVTSYLVDLKRQFEDQASHLGMVDDVLETLVNQQPEEFSPGSDRDPNIKI